MKNLVLLALAGLALTTACKKDDDTAPAVKQVSASLSPASEIPAVTTAPSATGTMTGTYDPASKMLTYSITYSGMSSAVSAAHLHFGDTKHKTAAPTVPFANVPTTTSGTFSGTAALTQTQADSLTAGKLYANIHTANNGNGEVRGNLTAK